MSVDPLAPQPDPMPSEGDVATLVAQVERLTARVAELEGQTYRLIRTESAGPGFTEYTFRRTTPTVVVEEASLLVEGTPTDECLMRQIRRHDRIWRRVRS